MRFAIAGTGVAARYHAQAVAGTSGARLVAVCRADRTRAAAASAEFGVPCETDYERLIARRDVDTVCICTPSGDHAAQALAALRAGKHVLVEKPMALTLADGEAMVAAARDADRHLGVSLQRRTEPAYRSLRAALLEGAFGRLVLATATVPYYRARDYYESAGWRGTWARDGGGALMNQGIHLADLLLWLAGDVDEVQAVVSTAAHAIEVEDDLAATLRFSSGALGSLVATTAAAPGFPHRIEIYGDRGGAQIEGDGIVRWEGETNRRPPLLAAAAGAGPGARPTGQTPSGHTRIVADFMGAVRDGRDPLVSGEEGLRSLALVLAIYEAARTGRPVRPTRPTPA